MYHMGNHRSLSNPAAVGRTSKALGLSWCIYTSQLGSWVYTICIS